MKLRIRSRYLLLFYLLSVCLPSYSQDTGCLTRTAVITVVGRRDKSGIGPVVSLSPENIRAKVDGKTVSVESVAPPSTPLRVSMVLDVGSSQDKGKWDAARSIAHNLPSYFPEGTEFSLVTFDEKVEQTVPLKRGPHPMDEFLATLSPSKTKESRKGLYEGLAAGIRTLDAPRPGDAVFLVTSWEGGDKSDAEMLVQQLVESKVRLFGISFDLSKLPARFPSGTFVSLTSFTAIESAARISGGLWMQAAGGGPALEDLTKASASLASDFYAVGVKLAEPLAKAKDLKIELVKGSKISLRSNWSIGDVILSYPQVLYPCH